MKFNLSQFKDENEATKDKVDQVYGELIELLVDGKEVIH